VSSVKGYFVKIALMDGLIRRKDAHLGAAMIHNSESQTDTFSRSYSSNILNAKTKCMVAKGLRRIP
jgi:hypothetical protein